MAHKCGQNRKTYNPSGDGFNANPGLAIAAAQADYGVSLGRCVRKIMQWANRPCPGGCPLKVFGGIANGALNQFVRWNNKLNKWHAHFDHRMTGIVLCLPMPKAKGGPKKAGKKKAKRARRR